jgi:hypothetical protein
MNSVPTSHNFNSPSRKPAKLEPHQISALRAPNGEQTLVGFICMKTHYLPKLLRVSLSAVNAKAGKVYSGMNV